MLKSSKWIKDTTPDLPVSKAARRAFDERLKRVWYYTKLAANKPQEDIEYVHQLRVSTRRARAALRLFGDLVPKRQARWLRKTLRRLRLAANDARDLDVLGERLALLVEQKQNSELSTVVDRVRARRCKAQNPLIQGYKQAKRQAFKNRSRALKNRVRWRYKRAEPNFADAARERLASPVAEFFTAAEADLSDPLALHAMRIAGKRLRYAMELLAGAFAAPFRDKLYPVFADLQDELGIVNDHATAIPLFTEWMTRAEQKGQTALAAELADLIAIEEQQLSLSSQAFRAAWTVERAAELKARFDAVLSGASLESAAEIQADGPIRPT